MTTAEILRNLRSMSALVVGDICLDRWCSYDACLMQPSRETGIPRVAVVRTEVTPGAAGTVANNLASLGVGKVAVLGAFGTDGFGFELHRALAARGILSDLCIESEKIQTFTYTKIINRNTGVEDQPRLDFINNSALPGDLDEAIARNLEDAVGSFDVILVSDQAETRQGGIVTPLLRSVLTRLASRYSNKVFFVDSRERLHEFRGLTIKANEDEARAACDRINAGSDFQLLLHHTEAPLLFVTRGSHGVLTFDRVERYVVETEPVESPVDICGAGDSFSAGAAMALAVTGATRQAAHFGNLVASITIMKPGTGTASPQEVLEKEAASQTFRR